MRDPQIPKILKEVEKYWKKYPDLRLGQLLIDVMRISDDLFYIEDDKLIERLKDFLPMYIREISPRWQRQQP